MTEIRNLTRNGETFYPLTHEKAVIGMEEFKETITEQIENYKPIEITGNVTNAPDEEDITSDSNNLLKFKNRNNLYGLGKVILRRGSSFASQVTLQNTIYVIQYNFDLGNARINIPNGSILLFEGGSLSNGTLVCADLFDVRLVYYQDISVILDSVTLEGNFIYKACDKDTTGSISVDNSSIEVNGLGQLTVKAGGIQNTHLNGSVVDQVGLVLDSNNKISIKADGTVSQIIGNMKGVANGIASLDSTGKVPSSQLPNNIALLDDDEGQAVIPGFDPETDTLHKAAQVLTTAEKDQVAANLNNRSATNGMARIELKATDNFKSVVESQTGGNTVFVIKYDFTLSGNVTIPANCVLEFDGGSISGAYTITGNNTGIQAGLVKIFNTDVTLSGTWNVVETYPEWFGVIPFDTLQDAYNGTDYIDLSDIASKLYAICLTIRLSDGYYKTLGTINVNNLVGNGKTSCIAAFASADEYTALIFGNGTLPENRLWNMTIDGVGIYLQSLSNNLKKTSCLTIKATTRCVVNNVTCWNYISKPSEFTDGELDSIPDVCNYGIVFDGNTELFTLSNYVVSGDIGIYFKTATDQISLTHGYIEGNNFSYAGIYGTNSTNLKIDGHLDIALGLCGIRINGTQQSSIMSMDNVRFEQLRSTSFSNHKNYVVDITGNVLAVVITNSYIPAYTNTFHTTVPLKIYGCFNETPGNVYLDNEFINAANVVEFLNCDLYSNGKIVIDSSYECYGILTPYTYGYQYSGVGVKNGRIVKKIDSSDTLTSAIYDFKGKGVFELNERRTITANFSNYLRYAPGTFKAEIKYFIVEIEVIDSEYYQKTAIRYSYNSTTNTLVFKDVLYNYGDNVFYPNGQTPTGMISVSGDTLNNMGVLYVHSTISRDIEFNIKYTCIAPNYDGNRG